MSMTKPRVIYHVYDGENEIEGMFDENGEWLGAWCCNDANWRNEYFDGFLEALGISVESAPEDIEEKAIEELRERFDVYAYSNDEDEDDPDDGK